MPVLCKWKQVNKNTNFILSNKFFSQEFGRVFNCHIFLGKDTNHAFEYFWDTFYFFLVGISGKYVFKLT